MTDVQASIFPPTHTSGAVVVTGSTASFLYLGTAAQVSANFDAVTGTVRSLNIVNAGSGYLFGNNLALQPGMVLLNNGALPTTFARGFAVIIQAQGGAANTLTQKSNIVPITGGINITSNQSVVGISTTSGGVNYSSAPNVGFQLPFGYRNLVTANGSGYTTTPTITISGGVKLTGGTDPTFAVIIAQGQVVSVIGTGAGTGWQVPPTLTITGGGGAAATCAYPAGCLPTATANLTNGTITSFTITNAGADYNAAAPTILLVTTGTVAVAANVPTCRVGFYSITLATFNGSESDATNQQGAEIPANGRIFVYSQSSGSAHFSTNIDCYSSFVLNGGIIDMGGNTLLCSNPGYAGVTGSITTFSTNRVTNGSFQVTTPGGIGLIRSFPFLGLSLTLGGSNVTDGTTITSLKGTILQNPTGTVNTGVLTGSRSIRVQVMNAGGAYGTTTNPVATLFYSAIDGIVSDNANLFLAQAAALTGPWTVRSVSSGTGVLSYSPNSRASAVGAPGPIALTGDDYLAWSTTFTQPAGLTYSVTRTTSNVYTSIMPAGLGGNGTGLPFAFTGTGATLSTDDGVSTIVSIPSSTFSYQGSAVTGFRVCGNGYIVLGNALSPDGSQPQWVTSFPLTTNRNVVAAFFDDLTTGNNLGTQADLDNSMRYLISAGAPGTRKITVEWYKMTLFGLQGPELYFQIVLDEADNSISLKYGNMQLYNGTQDIRWTYAAGLSGAFVAENPKPGQVLQQQYENRAAFDYLNGTGANVGANGLMISPEPRSNIKLTPGPNTAYSAPPTTPPGNDDYAGSIPLPSLTAFPTNIAWNDLYPSPPGSTNLFTTRYATTSPEAICGGSSSAKDVWFTFTANNPSMQVKIYASGGYIPRLEILQDGIPPTPLAPAQCVLGAQGSTATATLSGLTVNANYFIRVYHNQTGTTATGTATVTSGVVTAINVTNGGSNYTEANGGQITTSRVTITGGGGNGAVAYTSLVSGAVANIYLASGGSGYTGTPTVTVESPNWGLSGEFSVIVFAKADNDECITAVNLTGLNTNNCVNGANSRNNVVTSAATASAEATCTGNADDDVWYSFTAIGDTTTVTVTGNGTFDAVFQVFNGGSSPGGNCATKSLLSPALCIDSTGAGEVETTLVPTIIGNTYFVRVYHFGTGSGGVAGSFNICVTSAPPPCISAPLSPLNGGSSCENGVILKWNKATGALRYDVYLDAGGTASTLVSANQTDTVYTVPGTLTAGAYAWRVVPKNASGAATGCSTFTFTTVVQPNIVITPSPSASYCGSGSATLTASGAGNYTWTPATNLSATSGNSVTANPPLAAGQFQTQYTYTVIGYSVAGCPDTATQVVTVNKIPVSPTTTNYNQCLSGSTANQALTANCSLEIFSNTITVNLLNPLTDEGTNCPGFDVEGQFTLPALPAGASYIGAHLTINGITPRVVNVFASDVLLNFSGTGISDSTGCFNGSQQGTFSAFNYVTGAGFSAVDTATVAGILRTAGGVVTLRYSTLFNANNTVNDVNFPTTATFQYYYVVPQSTVKWYSAASGGLFLANGSPYNPGINSPSGTFTSFARCVTAAGCESPGTAASVIVGATLSVTASQSATGVICANSADTLRSTVTGGGAPYTYSWSNGASVVSTSASFIAHPAVNTTYTLTVTHQCPGSASSAVSVTVQASPPVAVTHHGRVCDGVGVDTLVATGATTYQWSPPDGLNVTTGSTVLAQPSVTTTYTVTGTNGAGCSTSASIVVNNYPHITLVATATPDTVCTNSASQLNSNAKFDTIPSGYCIPVQTGIACIDSVKFNTINRKSTSCGGSYYENVPRTTATTTILPGSTYSLRATFDSVARASVWIDFNRNGLFDANEWYQITTFGTSGTVSITVPSNAVSGYTRMRIRSRLAGNNNGSGDFCTVFGSGSTDDYTILIGTPQGVGSFTYKWNANADLSSTTIANPTATPTTVGSHNYVITATETASGCKSSATVTVVAKVCVSVITVNVKAIIQGYYAGGGKMYPAMYSELITGSNASQVDSVTIEAHATDALFTLIDKYTAVLDTGGKVTGGMHVAVLGTPYYIGVRHRSALFTCSANPVTFTSVTNYDFRLNPNSAFGTPFPVGDPYLQEYNLGDGFYAIYSGDVNGDEYIDTGDVTPVDNDNSSGAFSPTPDGYWISDVNGDGYVDTGDVTPVDNNNSSGVYSQHP